MPNNSGPNLHGKLDPSHTASKTQDIIDNMIRIGTITEVQLDSKGFPGEDIENMTNEDENGNFRYPLYKVRFDEDAEEKENETHWIPSVTQSAGDDKRDYGAYNIGTQVIVIIISGDDIQSYILAPINQDKYRPVQFWDNPTKDNRGWKNADTLSGVEFKDKTLWEYRRSDDEDFPGEPRFIAAFLRAANSFFQYGAKPDLRKLYIYIKDILIKLDETLDVKAKNMNIELEEDITIKCKNLTFEVANEIKINGLKGDIIIVEGTKALHKP